MSILIGFNRKQITYTKYKFIRITLKIRNNSTAYKFINVTI